MTRYFIIYKPYLVLSQFSIPSPTGVATTAKKTLKDLFNVPRDVYPVGRLDYDSEGLLLLTNDASLNYKLLHPSFKHQREYWVQVEGLIGEPALKQLRTGCTISVDGKPYRTQTATAEYLSPAVTIYERHPPIRFRKDIPTSWIRLVVTEGKNRQVRKMTAHVGYPTLRLIRHRIEQLVLGNLKPGEMRELDRQETYTSLRLLQ